MTPDTERAIFATCDDLWKRTFGAGMSDAAAMEAMLSELARGQVYAGVDSLSQTETSRHLAITKWIDCGTPRLITDEKYAAALMCTRVSESLVEDIIIPWKAFRIDLPRGVLAHDEYTYSQVLVASFEQGDPGAMLLLEGQRPALPIDGSENDVRDVVYATRTVYADTLAKLLLDREAPEDVFDDPGVNAQIRAEVRDAKSRACRLAIRLVVGLLYTMQYTQDFKPARPSLNDQRHHIRNGPPKHRTIFVGKPIKLDARAAVLEYCSNSTRRPPSVQTLVRGHFKRQVVGIGRAGRKVIWIEPHWRGPEEAPILARPIKVGPKDRR